MRQRDCKPPDSMAGQKAPDFENEILQDALRCERAGERFHGPPARESERNGCGVSALGQPPFRAALEQAVEPGLEPSNSDSSQSPAKGGNLRIGQFRNSQLNCTAIEDGDGRSQAYRRSNQYRH